MDGRESNRRFSMRPKPQAFGNCFDKVARFDETGLGFSDINKQNDAALVISIHAINKYQTHQKLLLY